MIRSNRFGLTFELVAIHGGTEISLKLRSGTKTILVASPLAEMSQGWYNWQQKGMFVQDAFHFLNADEREFLQTGLTPTEFEAMAKAMEEME